MVNMINKSFDNLAQRSIYYFLATIPSFKAVSSKEATEDQQRNAYDFIKGIYEKLCITPSLLGLKLEPDDSFGDWKQQKVKPKLAPKIRSTIKKIDDFVYLIYRIVSIGQSEEDRLKVNINEFPLKPTVLKQLANFDIQAKITESDSIFTFPHETMKALKLLAKISTENVKPPKDGKQKFHLLFSRGVFDVQSPYTREIFENMFDNKTAYNKLIGFLDEAGYTRIDNKEYGNSISLD